MLERRLAPNGVVYYASPLLEAVGVPHAFSTRIGGLSPSPFDSLNLGNPSGCATQDDYERIYQNYDRLQSVTRLSDRQRCWVHQVHGGIVCDLRRGRAFVEGFKADAMISDDPARVLSVRTADCVPVLLARADGSIVAAVHAGWRGVIAGAVVNALRALDPPHETIAAIGPSIGAGAFEVGPEVLEQFQHQFNGRAPLRRRDDGRGYVDLREAIRLQLIGAGVGADNIDTTDRCTHRDADEFFSHRRDNGITGRMASLIAPRGAS